MNNIYQLLKKYWDTETSVEEEKIIKKSLSVTEDIDLQNEKLLFTFFENEKKISYQGNLPIGGSKVVKHNFIRSIAVAASIVLLMSYSALIFTNNGTGKANNLVKHEITDPDEALEIAKDALTILAVNYKKGEETVTSSIEKLEKLDIIKQN
jgi:hypothetical protein